MYSYKKIIEKISGKKDLIENIVSLMSIRGLEYLSYIVLIPYLVRVLGPNKFGVLALVQAVLQYFVVINNYGFNYSSTREIAICSENKERLHILCTTLASKLLIFLFSSLIFGLALYLDLFPIIDIRLFLVCYVVVIGNVLFPIYFFQGIEKMRFLTVSNIISRVICIVCVFCFVKNEDDYILAGFLQSMPPLISALIAFLLIVRIYGINFVNIPNWNDIKISIINGWDLFLAGVASNLYTSSNVVVLGYMVPAEIVGYYSGADKIIRSIIGVFTPVTQALYPYVSRHISISSEHAKDLVKRIFKIYLFLGLAMTFICYCYGEYFVVFLLGDKFINSIELFEIMTPLLLIILLSGVCGVVILVAFGLKKYFRSSLLSGMCINFVLIFPMINFFDAKGLAITNLIVEGSILCLMLCYIRKYIYH